MTQERDKSGDNCGSRGAHALCKQLLPGVPALCGSGGVCSCSRGTPGPGAPWGQSDSGHVPLWALQVLPLPWLGPIACARAAAAAARSWIYFPADISFQTASAPLGSERVLCLRTAANHPDKLLGVVPPGAAGAQSSPLPSSCHKSVPGDWNRTWRSHGTFRVRAGGIGLLGNRQKTRRGFVKK